MERYDRCTENQFGIALFTWIGCNKDTGQDLNFCDVNFVDKSMQKYNGNFVTKYFDGRMEILDINDKILWRGYPIDIPEFWEKLTKYKKEKTNG